MANENRKLITNWVDWATTDKSKVLDNTEIVYYYNAADGIFYIIGDGTRTLQQIYDADEIMGGVLDSTNFDARITALIGSSTNGLIDKKNGFRGSLATNPTAAWSAGTYLPGAVVSNNDLYYFLYNSTSTTTEPAAETEWELCPDFQTASRWTKGTVFSGWGSLSDPKSADFKNYYKVGEYIEGSNEFDLYRINVAGQVTSTSATDFYKLVDASDVKTEFSTFVTDHYELEDYRGAAEMSGDASGGERATNGTRQDFATQRMTGTAERGNGDVGFLDAAATVSGVLAVGSTSHANLVTSAANTGYDLKVDTAGQTGQTYNTSGDGLGNEGSDPGETYPNNVANGCLCVHVLIARGTISSVSG